MANTALIPANQKPKRLTKRQERFVNEYLVDLNGTQAAIRAGYSKKENPAAAAVLASTLLKNHKVRQLIDEKLTAQGAPLPYLIQKLAEIIQNPVGKDSDKVQAIDKLLKAGGHYTQKVEHSGSLQTPIINITLNYDDEEAAEADGPIIDM